METWTNQGGVVLFYPSTAAQSLPPVYNNTGAHGVPAALLSPPDAVSAQREIFTADWSRLKLCMSGALAFSKANSKPMSSMRMHLATPMLFYTLEICLIVLYFIPPGTLQSVFDAGTVPLQVSERTMWFMLAMLLVPLLCSYFTRQGPLKAAKFYPVFKWLRGHQVQPEDFFYGYRFASAFNLIALLELLSVSVAVYLAICSPLALLFYVPAFAYLHSIALRFTLPLVVDRSMSLWDATRVSMSHQHAHLPQILLLNLCVSALSFLIIAPLLLTINLPVLLYLAAISYPDNPFSAGLVAYMSSPPQLALLFGVYVALFLLLLRRLRPLLRALPFLEAFIYDDLFGVSCCAPTRSTTLQPAV